MANIKFQIYYATKPQGPWTLANNTPLDNTESGSNSYTISGLQHDTAYYVAVVPGEVDEFNNFYPRLNQPVGPTGEGASNIGVVRPQLVSAKTFAPQISASNSLGHQFTFGFNGDSPLGHEINISGIATGDSLGMQYQVALETDDTLGHELNIGSIATSSGLAHEFTVTIPVFEETFEGDGGIRAWNEDYWHRNEISPTENISWADAQVNTTETVESFGTGW